MKYVFGKIKSVKKFYSECKEILQCMQILKTLFYYQTNGKGISIFLL